MPSCFNIFRKKRKQESREEVQPEDTIEPSFIYSIGERIGFVEEKLNQGIDKITSDDWDKLEDKIQEKLELFVGDRAQEWRNKVEAAERKAEEWQKAYLREKQIRNKSLFNDLGDERENQIESNIDNDILLEHINQNILGNEDTNMKLVPDFVERQAWALALRQIMYGISEISIDLYGHTLKFYLEPKCCSGEEQE